MATEYPPIVEITRKYTTDTAIELHFPHSIRTLPLEGAPIICRAGVYYLKSNAFKKFLKPYSEAKPQLCRKEWILTRMLRKSCLSYWGGVQLRFGFGVVDLDEVVSLGYRIGTDTEEGSEYIALGNRVAYSLNEQKYELVLRKYQEREKQQIKRAH